MDDSSNEYDGGNGDGGLEDEDGSSASHALGRREIGVGGGRHREDERFELENLALSPSPGYVDGFISPRTDEELKIARQPVWTNSVASSSRSRM